jgi:hypothetical protein
MKCSKSLGKPPWKTWCSIRFKSCNIEILKEFKKLLEQAVSKDKDILSAGIRLKSGVMAVQTSHHAATFTKPISAMSTLDFIHVELMADNQPWGDFEIAFQPVQETYLF